MPLPLKICSAPSSDLVHLNLVYVGHGVFNPAVRYVKLQDHVFGVCPHQSIAPTDIALNTIQRRSCKVSPGDSINVEPFTLPTQKFTLDSLNIEIDFVVKKNMTVKIDGTAFIDVFRTRYSNQVFTVGQTWVMDFEGTNYLLKAVDLAVIDEVNMTVEAASSFQGRPLMGMVGRDTKPLLKVGAMSDKLIKLSNMPLSTSLRSADVFKKDWNFETLGIGGLDTEFGAVFRRAFGSRIFPPSIVEKLGVTHVKGILLHGPPGTGKTLMARQIGKMLNCKEPKKVNGPEILNKYVGQSEENIRNLFADAEAEYAEKGEESDLHLIIFDEIDAICKQRGASRDGTGVGDSVVNQLLSKIDGVDAVNNVIVIGMTNRKDMLDEALMRPGRFEVHIEIGLPDLEGRVQIFNIHTARARDNNMLGSDVDIRELATLATNFSGAEISGLVRSAQSFAINKFIDVNNLGKQQQQKDMDVVLTRADFMSAFDEVRPALGQAEVELEKLTRNGLFDYGPESYRIKANALSFIQQLKSSSRTDSLSVLLEGPQGSGKTAVAAAVALNSEFPFVKVVSTASLIGYGEISKCNLIRKIFDDAYKSPLSVIILDDVERLIEYVHLGPRFSNPLLQTILTLLRASPPAGKKLLILGTTSNLDVLESTDLSAQFNAIVHIPQLSKMAGDIERVLSILKVQYASKTDEAAILSLLPAHISVKTLMLVAEMAQALAVSEGAPGITEAVMEQALKTCGCELG
jgi:vesicle-fusing ATPase